MIDRPWLQNSPEASRSWLFVFDAGLTLANRFRFPFGRGKGWGLLDPCSAAPF
jgi:hypothetical protein